jgi:hypothetical protein
MTSRWPWAADRPRLGNCQQPHGVAVEGTRRRLAVMSDRPPIVDSGRPGGPVTLGNPRKRSPPPRANLDLQATGEGWFVMWTDTFCAAVGSRA